MSTVTGTDVDLLKRAAVNLRAHAGLASPGPWNSAGNNDEATIGNDLGHTVAETHRCVEHPNLHPYDADYITMMHPPVAVEVARWLDAAVEVAEANDYGDGFDLSGIDDTHRSAVAVARAILREEA